MPIAVLPAQIRDQIAAGEVVERPASVVKELVENSLDAGATHVQIEIANGGKKKILVRDNGQGMNEADAEKAVLRHATSKIQVIDDLFTIQSFGFRGEALAAMAAVSQLTLTTRDRMSDQGAAVSVRAGGRPEVNRVSAPAGTTVLIENLFYPTPARLQYLKTDDTEYRAILKEINGFALCNPTVHFTLQKDEKVVLDLPSMSPKDRVQTILKLKGAILDLNHAPTTSRGIKVTGFVGAPGDCIRNKNQQWCFVNGRRIEDFKLAYAVREAYVQSCGIEKHLQPVFSIFIEIDPILVDVNVHPRKLEVKFAEPGEVFATLKMATTEALRAFSMGQNEVAGVVRSFAQFKAHGGQHSPNPRFSFNNPASTSTSPTFAQRYEQNTDLLTEPTPLPNSDELKVLCQLEKKYILATTPEGIFFFDQHALHERQRFEEFWQEYKGSLVDTQKLLVPQRIYLSESDISLLSEKRAEISQTGLLIQFPADNCVSVLEIPKILENEDLKSVFERIIEYLQAGQVGENIIDQMMRKILEYKACRGAVMFGDHLDMAEMEKLIADFDKTDWKLLCPHGRPNHWFVPYSDLDKKFHR